MSEAVDCAKTINPGMEYKRSMKQSKRKSLKNNKSVSRLFIVLSKTYTLLYCLSVPQAAVSLSITPVLYSVFNKTAISQTCLYQWHRQYYMGKEHSNRRRNSFIPHVKFIWDSRRVQYSYQFKYHSIR